jgi:hypothetical protein
MTARTMWGLLATVLAVTAAGLAADDNSVPNNMALTFQRPHGLSREFGADGLLRESIDTPHLKLTYWASDAPLISGSRVSLIVEIETKPKMHVYAPGVERYIPIDWRMADSKAWDSFPVSYPPARMLNLPAIKATVPVFDGHFQMTREIAIGQEANLAPALSSDRTLTVEGSFRYQACDDKQCYLPATLPLKWSFIVEKPNTERTPQALQRKAK